MANYCSWFIKYFSTITSPLRELTKKDTPWLLSQMQNGQKFIIAYASRALSDVEKQYSKTECEALAIVWSCVHFHLYLYGHHFILVTDHKPLELIWNNSKSKPPARIERWGLRLPLYNFRIKYRKGADNPAEFMSRHRLRQNTAQGHP